MPNIVPFSFNGSDIPAIQDEKGEPWWRASDVCQQCDIKNVSDACERLDADEKAVIVLTDSAGRPQDTLIVNEAGLYTLSFRSRKAGARAFRRWVTHEVLPSIRKTGKYEVAPALDRFPELRAIVELAQSTAEARLVAEEAKAHATEAKIEAAKANANAERALDTQQFLTVAEYVYINQLKHQLPESAYKACSDHLRMYCMDQRIPFRKIPVGGHRWNDEYGFHVSVYADVFPGWLMRRNGQSSLPDVYHEDWNPRDA